MLTSSLNKWSDTQSWYFLVQWSLTLLLFMTFWFFNVHWKVHQTVLSLINLLFFLSFRSQSVLVNFAFPSLLSPFPCLCCSSGYMVSRMHYGRNGSPQNPLPGKGLYPYVFCCNLHWKVSLLPTAASFPTFPIRQILYDRNAKSGVKSWILEVCVIMIGAALGSTTKSKNEKTKTHCRTNDFKLILWYNHYFCQCHFFFV